MDEGAKWKANTNLLVNKEAENKYNKYVDWLLSGIVEYKRLEVETIYLGLSLTYMGFDTAKNKKATIYVKLPSNNFRSWGFEMTIFLSIKVQDAVQKLSSAKLQRSWTQFCLHGFFCISLFF